MVRDFGTSDDSGAANGATFATPAGARVVAPCGGKVAFAGLFRSYGQLLIVDCGGGLHGVLAGLGRLDVALGQVVQLGEPVGVMGGDAAAEAGASLYFEVRRNGVAVDPRQYLRPKG